MYFAGTYPAAASDPALAFLRNVLHQHLVDAGITYVEEVVHSATNVTRVYQLSGGRYFALNAGVTSANNIQPIVFEGYVLGGGAGSVTKRAYNGNGGVALGADGASSAAGITLAVAANALNTTYVQVATGGGQYWLSVTPERVILCARNGSTDQAIYVGGLASVPAAATVPVSLFVGVLSGSSNVFGSTREPGITSAQTVTGALSGTLKADAVIATTADTYSAKFPVSRVRVASSRAGEGRRGLLRDVFVMSNATPVAGDTSTIDGRLHVCMRWSSGAYFVDTTV